MNSVLICGSPIDSGGTHSHDKTTTLQGAEDGDEGDEEAKVFVSLFHQLLYHSVEDLLGSRCIVLHITARNS